MSSVVTVRVELSQGLLYNKYQNYVYYVGRNTTAWIKFDLQFGIINAYHN